MCCSKSTWAIVVLSTLLIGSFFATEKSQCVLRPTSSSSRLPSDIADYTGPVSCSYTFAHGMISLTFDGRLTRGSMTGKGVYTDNGDIYVGYFANNERHGPGNMTLKDGTVIEGDWKSNLPHGRLITYTLPNDTGVWYDTLTETGISRAHFAGDFEDGNMQGVGVMSFPDGVTYKGMFNRSATTGPGSLQVGEDEYAIYGTFYSDTGTYAGIIGKLGLKDEYNVNCSTSYLGVHCQAFEDPDTRHCGELCNSAREAFQRVFRVQARISMDIMVRLRVRMYDWKLSNIVSDLEHSLPEQYQLTNRMSFTPSSPPPPPPRSVPGEASESKVTHTVGQSRRMKGEGRTANNRGGKEEL